MGYRIRNLSLIRQKTLKLIENASGPVLICPNHLTWIDSMLVQWALFSPLDLPFSFRYFAWNLPERANFWSNLPLRLMCYLGKCIPITRGGDRGGQRIVLEKTRHLLEEGELVLVFPEGGRSTGGKLDRSRYAYGVGQIVGSVRDCHVLCVYLRGDRQRQSTLLPERNQAFSVAIELIRPSANKRGFRGSVEIARNIVDVLADLEDRFFAHRQ